MSKLVLSPVETRPRVSRRLTQAELSLIESANRQTLANRERIRLASFSILSRPLEEPGAAKRAERKR